MEVLQLILNVIIITGVTTLALTWYLQKRDDRKLTIGLNLSRESDQHDEKTPLTQTPSTMDQQDGDSLKQPLCAPDQDIRQYVAHRARRWAALSVAGATPPDK
jgi:hypothetical protein